MSAEVLELIAVVSLVFIAIIGTVGFSFGVWYDFQSRKRW